MIRLCSLGKAVDKVTLSALAPASAKQVEKPKTRLTVTSKRDYPLTEGFPSSLEYLQVTGCKLKRMDTRMLQLNSLRILDLSNNSLAELPAEIGQMRSLSELKLANNNITDLSKDFCQSNVRKTLFLLDLSANKLKFLRPDFCELTGLTRLKLDGNELMCLPHRISRLVHLRFLSASQNQLKVLPPGFGLLNLEELDLFGNPFMNDGPSTAISRLEFPALMELSARAIHHHRYVCLNHAYYIFQMGLYS